MGCIGHDHLGGQSLDQPGVINALGLDDKYFHKYSPNINIGSCQVELRLIWNFMSSNDGIIIN